MEYGRDTIRIERNHSWVLILGAVPSEEIRRCGSLMIMKVLVFDTKQCDREIGSVDRRKRSGTDTMIYNDIQRKW